MLRLNCLEFELFYLTNNTLLPNGKNKQRKLIQHVLILSTSHSLIKKTCQWLEAKTNLQSSLDWKFIFTGTDNWSEVQHKITAKTWVKNVHRLYDHKQLASQQLITQLENIGWDKLTCYWRILDWGKGKREGLDGRVTIFLWDWATGDWGAAELLFSIHQYFLLSCWIPAKYLKWIWFD